jgi:hypothetical protein
MTTNVDHYNWKFPTRKDLMNLSQIGNSINNKKFLIY